MQDYHNSSSKGCKKNDDDPLSDELRGLINFMKGNDYFDYDSDCDLIEVRDHVMGDVYHSQLIEVGAPEANIQFSGKNEEAYYRATRGYERFMGQYSNRKNYLCWSNSGMLHAFDAVTGKEEWAFIPPFVGALIPQIINPDYNQKIQEVQIRFLVLMDHQLFMMCYKRLRPKWKFRGFKKLAYVINDSLWKRWSRFFGLRYNGPYSSRRERSHTYVFSF